MPGFISEGELISYADTTAGPFEGSGGRGGLLRRSVSICVPLWFLPLRLSVSARAKPPTSYPLRAAGALTWFPPPPTVSRTLRVRIFALLAAPSPSLLDPRADFHSP